jgi:hypothetical protein
MSPAAAVSASRLHICTPLLKSLPLSKAAGLPVYLKLDALQPRHVHYLGKACIDPTTNSSPPLHFTVGPSRTEGWDTWPPR